ncbi:hypothetical protein ON010_g4916 [Phytophthora cinnamomi]|nr:hypothetical protein ON010_g4916 [Phytophthora cinnamomi]
MRRMFATPKKSRKKPRSQAQAQAASTEQTTPKVLTARKKNQSPAPISRAFQNADGSTAANPVNLLQVRKKRKISPTPVPPVTPLEPTAGPHATKSTNSAPAASVPAATAPAASVPAATSPAASVPAARVPAASAPTDIIDLSSPSTAAEPAPAATQTQLNDGEEHAGTFDDPLNI